MLKFLPLLTILQLANAATLHAPPTHLNSASQNQNAYFAIFQSQPGTPAAVKEHQRFKAQLKALRIPISERYSYTEVTNGVSFEVSKSHLLAVSSIDIVKDIFPLLSSTPPKTYTSENSDPELRFSHGITGVAEVRSTLGLTGKNIKVGIIDSGIDYKHPALGGCFGKGCRVAYGYDYVGDDYDGADPNKPAVPDDDPMDCGGHGTHVAGIVGAKDKDFEGVAPDVTLGAYRIFGCSGSSNDDVILAAMEQAYKDGMDIINMSLGAGSSWPQYPLAAASDVLAEKGLIVVSSAGNNGASGAFNVGSPGHANKGFGVASFDNIRYYAYSFGIDGEDKLMDYANGDEKKYLELENIPLARYIDQNGDDMACSPVEGLDLKGKIALIQRGICTFLVKVQNAQAAGATAVLIYNRVFGHFAPAAESPDIKIPSVGTSLANGKRLIELLESHSITLTFGKVKGVFDNPTGGKVSDFSSWGPGPELTLKPDIGAPGGLMYSTYPMKKGAYATLSGTSMASPYTAGSAALYIQAKGKKSGVELRNIFKNTANPTTNWETSTLASAFRQGAGLINLKGALQTETLVLPAQMPLNSTDAGSSSYNHYLTIFNNGKKARSFTLSHKPASSVKPWNNSTNEIDPLPEHSDSKASVTFAYDNLLIPPGESRRLRVKIQPPEQLPEDERWLYSGYIVVETKSASKYPSPREIKELSKQVPIHIPYGGMKGNYKQVKILAHPDSGFPVLSSKADELVLTGKNETIPSFSMKGNDIPAVSFRLIHPCRRVVFRLLNGTNGNDMGMVNGGDNRWLGQNGNTPKNSKYEQLFNGTYMEEPGRRSKTPANSTFEAPDGVYKLKLKALKMYGSESKESSYEQWDSIAFRINRTLPEKKGGSGIENRRGLFVPQLEQRVRQNGQAVRKKAEHLAETSMLLKEMIMLRNTQ